MTFFYNQKQSKCKKRHPIKIEDVPINLKLIGTENIHVIKEEENVAKSTSDVIDLNNVPQKVSPEKATQNKVEIFNSQISLQKLFKKWSKASYALLNELVNLLNDGSICVNQHHVKIYSDFEELKSDSYYLINDICQKDSALEVTFSQSNMHHDIADRRQTMAKDRSSTHATNCLQESKINAPCIQFVLSSDKCSNWILDNNFQLTFSTIEWAVTKLTICIKHRECIDELDRKNPNHSKSKILFYNDNSKVAATTNIYENAKSLNEILFCLSSSLNMNINENNDKSGLKLLEVVSNDRTRTIMYPSGDVAILHLQESVSHLVQVYNDNTKQLLAQFSNSFGGMVFWTENNNLRVSITHNGCKMLDLNSGILRDMKWPCNTNNKLSHSINIRWNEHVSFLCSGKDSIVVRFETNEEKSKCFEIKIHNWLFRTCNPSPEKQTLIASMPYVSQTAAELTKAIPTKQSKKEDTQKSMEDKDQISVILNELKYGIRSIFGKWIGFVKEKVQLDGKLIQRKTVQSATLRNGRTVTFDTRTLESTALCVQRNISAPLRYISVEKSLLCNKDSPKRLFSGRLKTAIEAKESPISGILCPLKIRSRLLRKVGSDFPPELLNPESCLCSKSSITEITDLELSNFLRMAPTNQLVIIGVMNTQNDGSSEEHLKEKFIEDSLSSLLSDLYEEDLKKSTQKPCLVYTQKSYRIYFYDIGNSGRFLNSTQSLLLRKHNILPGMCLMFKETKLLFADYIFNGYNSTKTDLFKQINLSEKLFKNGFHLPNDFQLNFNNKSKQWIEDTAYSKIKVYTYNTKTSIEDQLSST